MTTTRAYVIQTTYGNKWYDANSARATFPATPEGKLKALETADEFGRHVRVILRSEQVVRDSPLQRAQRESARRAKTAQSKRG